MMNASDCVVCTVRLISGFLGMGRSRITLEYPLCRVFLVQYVRESLPHPTHSRRRLRRRRRRDADADADDATSVLYNV
jgi:hypothetical protein